MRPGMLVLTALLVIPGCSAPALVQVSPGVYMISKTSAAGSVFANMAKLKAGVIREANEFAASKGKIATPINMREEKPVPGFPLVEYQFRLVDPGSQDGTGTYLKPRADKVIEENKSIDIIIEDKTPQKEDSSDLYSELIRLDDLRKRGILTDEEFEEQKQILLAK